MHSSDTAQSTVPLPAERPGTRLVGQHLAGPDQERGLAGTALGALGVAAMVGLLALLLEALREAAAQGSFAPGVPGLDGSYSDWLRDAAGFPLPALLWVLGDLTEPLFYKSSLAAAGLIAGVLFAWTAIAARHKWAGSLGDGTSRWPWVVASAVLSLLLSNLAFGWMLDGGWQPTFVPLVSVAPAIVILYGGGWRTCVTGAVLGAAFVTPLALVFIATVSTPLDLPPVVANVLAMSAGCGLAFLLARRLPWLELQKPGPRAQLDQPSSGVRLSLLGDARWGARRVLKDFTETHFIANEVASLGMVLGVCVAWAFSPALPAYGSHLLPHILFAQALTSAIGVVLWRKWYRGGGWAATYASVVSVAPAAVLMYGGSWTGVVGGAVLGAVLAPPLARLIAARLPGDFHPVIANTAAMAVATALTLVVLGFVPGG